MVLTDLAETLVQNRLCHALLGDLMRFSGPVRSAFYRWFTDPAERLRYPAASQILVERVKRQRFAEANGVHHEVLAMQSQF